MGGPGPRARRSGLCGGGGWGRTLPLQPLLDALAPAAGEGVVLAAVSEAMRRVLARVAVRPAVLLLDDVHLADGPTLELLARLCAGVPSGGG